MLADITSTLTAFITSLYTTAGLAGIVLAMAIESCCIPLPSEIVMPVAGVMLASGKILSGVNSTVGLLLVALAGATGCLIGSIAAYGIGYSGGRPLLLKYGRYVLISQHDADRADRFFQRWGSATTFFSRLLPVIRTYISLPAGIAKMPFVKFCIFTFLGSFPWCLLLAYVGTVIGNSLSTLSPIFHSLDLVILVGLVVLVALYIWRHIRNDRKARAEHAAALAAAAQQAAQQNAWLQQPSTQPQPDWQQQQWNQPQQGWQAQQWGQQGQQPWPPQQGWAQPQTPPSSPPQQQEWGQPQQWGRVQSPPQQPWPPRNDNGGRDGQRF